MISLNLKLAKMLKVGKVKKLSPNDYFEFFYPFVIPYTKSFIQIYINKDLKQTIYNSLIT